MIALIARLVSAPELHGCGPSSAIA